ncbi:unnamed protein product [Sphagnum troendelagicum]|uniref:Histone deacetylase domain-containing protein n=1 Tax=Sphagnum troendelagicum TaxID=128251 RepID=A0ABP0V438_9BRYO
MAASGVGLVYDSRMCAHENESDRKHPEQPARITSIYQRLTSAGVVARCVKVEAREATNEELSSVHTQNHVELMKAVSSKSYGKHRRKALASRYDSIFFNNGSSKSALLAAGSVIEVADQVAQGKLKAGAAIVRPPGHHSEADAAMGFCLFNNVAVAAHLLVHKKKELGVQKLLIVDWDIHHGNGTQHMFWSDPQVLYFSVHRFDKGSFYPPGDEGNYNHLGADGGAGYNINVPWPHGQFGDADYLAVWEHVLMPVAHEYNPDMVLISAGFDSAEGDPLGGCRVTPSAYYKMTKQLMEVAEGRVVIALEGGYNLTSTSNSYLACMHALLGDVFPEKPTHLSNLLAPTLPLIDRVRNELQQYWSVLSTDQKKTLALKKGVSPLSVYYEEARKGPSQNIEETTKPGSSKEVKGQSMDAIVLTSTTNGVDNDENGYNVATEVAHNSEIVHPSSVGSSKGKTFAATEGIETHYVWYACYGSNMWLPQFMCYIQGGQVEGIVKDCIGCRDPSPPRASLWLTVSNQLFFGCKHSYTWGIGGVAFIDPLPEEDVKTYVHVYKITLEQFKDIFFQENSIMHMENQQFIIDTDLIQSVRNGQPATSHTIFEDRCYGTIIYLGDEDGIPILSFTCSLEDMEKFRSGDLEENIPAAAYEQAVARSLINDMGLSEGEARDYIGNARLSRSTRVT